MIPLLLLGDATPILTAGSAGGAIGYGDGTTVDTTTYDGTRGNLTIDPFELANLGIRVHYLHTIASTILEFVLDGNPGSGFTSTYTLNIGANSYALSAASTSSGADGTFKYIWTSGVTALADSTDYEVTLS